MLVIKRFPDNSDKSISILILSEDDLVQIENVKEVLKGTRGQTHDIVCIPNYYSIKQFKQLEVWSMVKPTISRGDHQFGQIKGY